MILKLSVQKLEVEVLSYQDEWLIIIIEPKYMFRVCIGTLKFRDGEEIIERKSSDWSLIS